MNSVRSVISIPPFPYNQLGTRLNRWSHRSGCSAERFEKESASSKRQRRKRSDYSNQTIPTAVPRAPEQFPVVSGEAIRMDRANHRNEQRDSIASQPPAAKHRHVAQYDDHRKRKIYGGPA